MDRSALTGKQHSVGRAWDRGSITFLAVKYRDGLIAVLVGTCVGGAFLISPVAGITLTIAAAMVLVSLVNPMLLCYMVIAGIVLTSGMKRGLLLPYLIPNEAILVGAAGLSLPIVLVNRLQRIRIPRLLLIATAILIGGTAILPLVTYYLRGFSLSVSEVMKLVAPIQYVLLFFLFITIPQNDRDRRRIMLALVAGSVVIALVGLLQWAHFGPVIRLLDNWYSSSHEASAINLGRITSLMSAWNGLGTFLVVNILLLLSLLDVDPSFLKRGLVVILLCILCLLASGSYAGVIGVVLGTLIVGRFNRRLLLYTALIFLVFVIAVLPLQQHMQQRTEHQFGGGGLIPQTLQFRFQVWREVFWPVIQQNWLWGYRITLESLSWQFPESQYFYYLLRSGIFSLFAHLAWVGLTLIWLALRIRREGGLERSLAVTLFAMFIMLSIMGLTNEVFTYSGTMDYIWILLGLLVGSERRALWLTSHQPIRYR